MIVDFGDFASAPHLRGFFTAPHTPSSLRLRSQLFSHAALGPSGMSIMHLWLERPKVFPPPKHKCPRYAPVWVTLTLILNDGLSSSKQWKFPPIYDFAYNIERGQNWMRTSLNEDNIEWGQHWMTTTLNEDNIEWGQHWMRTTLNKDNIEWGQHWMRTT